MIGRLSPRRRRAAAPADGAALTASLLDATAPAPPGVAVRGGPEVTDPSAADQRARDAVGAHGTGSVPAEPGGPARTTVGSPAGGDHVAAPLLALPLAHGAEVVLPAPDPSAPAGSELASGADVVPSFRNRGRVRRRLRFLRRARELGFRDVGGLVFDLHRYGREGQALVEGKLQALDAVDRELRALERALGDRREYTELREPGIAACPRCGTLHGSDAHFCPNCGLHLDGPLALAGGAPGTVAGGAAHDHLPTAPRPLGVPKTQAATASRPVGVPETQAATASRPVGVPETQAATASRPLGVPETQAATASRPVGVPETQAARTSEQPTGWFSSGPGATEAAEEDGVRAADTGNAPVSSGFGPLSPPADQAAGALGEAAPPQGEPGVPAQRAPGP
jgi:hypothetical protein